MSPTSYQLLYPAILLCTGIGAGDRTRTGTVLLPGDFKSPVSTIPPHRRRLAMIRIPHFPGCVNPFFEKHKNNKEKALRPSLYSVYTQLRTQHFSKIVATPIPPPMHRVARPFLASGRFCISCSRVTMIRAPEAPTG